jgi:RimJ/RimL family protein N-acetyltransferase
METYNEFGQAIGEALQDWQEPLFPPLKPLVGTYARLEPLALDHAADLFAANTQDKGMMWTYMPYGPFANLSAYKSWLKTIIQGQDPQFYALIEVQSQKALGVASYLRIAPSSGSIEVGHIAFSPLLQQTIVATEAMYLMMKNAFDLRYRRYEWKCDALNAKSRAAAQRLGFSFEGIFRQATHYKGRNRDTAWFAVIDKEWPTLKQAFETWLEPTNFDAAGKQKRRLSDLNKPLLYKKDTP